MKKSILLGALAILSLVTNAQDVSISMGENYEDRVFYKLSDGTINNYSNLDWDVAFYRIDNYEFAIRVNDGKGLQVYEAASSPSEWDNIDVADAGSWSSLYNSDTQWALGAFDNGSATYGWGEYNPATHHVEGAVVFVIENAAGEYTKFFIEDFYGGYTFKYATWNGSAWSADQTHTVSNTSNEGHLFNYFSLTSNQEVMAAPALEGWDLAFMRYATDVGGGMMYVVTGVLHRPGITVAKHDETSGAPDINDLTYVEDINTIGYDWKGFNGSTYDVDSDTGYYIKTEYNHVYKVIFTEFEGGDSGNVSFTLGDMGTLGTNDISANSSFALYPNPTTDKQVMLTLHQNNPNTSVAIYNITGSKVFETAVTATNATLNLSQLPSGMYMATVTTGDIQETKKLIVR